MYKIYDQNGDPAGFLTDYESPCIESELSTGDKTLSFTYCAQKSDAIKNEYYIETQTDRFVVKEIRESSNGFPEYQCELDLEDLEADMWETYSVSSVTLEDAANLALAGTGWTVDTDITKVRSAGVMKATPLTILGTLRDAWMCEMQFDTKNKIVRFREQFGEDKGVYLITGLNLRKTDLTSDTRDYYTRIIPIGADGLKIGDINNGKDYVENYQYSSKIRTLIWEDTSYEDEEALKEDAEKKLEDLSKPKKSYSVDLVDLAKQQEKYSLLSFSLGDTVLLVDERTGIRDSQRIVKLTEYPQNPEKNTCELSNTVLSFEEYQEKLDAAAAAVENITNSDGTVNGVYVHGVEADGIVGIETVIEGSSAVQTLNTQVSEISENVDSIDEEVALVNSELDAAKARIGTLETTSLTATEAELKYATIESLEVTNENVHSLQAEYAEFESTTTEELKADTAKITDLEANKADIDFANVLVLEAAQSIIENLLVTGGIITDDITSITGQFTKYLTGVNISGDLITAGTISTERLIIRSSDSDDGILFAINDVGELDQTKLSEEELKRLTLDGKLITAGTITADKIAVTDLSAFNATIGGFNITTSSIYSANENIILNADGTYHLGNDTGYIDFDGSDMKIHASSMTIGGSAVATEETVKVLKEEMLDEVAITLYIDSSNGLLFKSDAISTVLTVVIYRGSTRVTDMETLKSLMGDNVSLQWSFQRMGDDTVYEISDTDTRIQNEGFQFVVNPDDVDAKATFFCDLIVENDESEEI